MKLKTLKDLKPLFEDNYPYMDEILREEAIKWVKEWKSDERLSYPTATVFENAPLALIQLELETKIKVIMEKFNLTEEDLKDNQELKGGGRQ